jgi:hypothetical protein
LRTPASPILAQYFRLFIEEILSHFFRWGIEPAPKLGQYASFVCDGTGSRKSGLKPVVPPKSKVAVSKLKFWNSLN